MEITNYLNNYTQLLQNGLNKKIISISDLIKEKNESNNRVFIAGNIFDNYWADISKLMMLLTSLFFTIQCIRSFIHARKNKELSN